jgi:polysaccharide biosynthesis/export protein
VSSKRSTVLALVVCVLVCGSMSPMAAGQVPTSTGQTPAGGNASNPGPDRPVEPVGVTPPADYVIGPDDLLAIVFWRDKDMSAEVAVRPDGRISLPLLNEIDAAGLTPEALRLKITEAANKYVEQPTVAVVVKTINSRKVFITGQVGKPGAYPLTGPMTVVQLLTLAGGTSEFADEKDINILRTENGKQVSLRFNYKDVKRGKNLAQNIELKPNDTVMVP